MPRERTQTPLSELEIPRRGNSRLRSGFNHYWEERLKWDILQREEPSGNDGARGSGRVCRELQVWGAGNDRANPSDPHLGTAFIRNLPWAIPAAWRPERYPASRNFVLG